MLVRRWLRQAFENAAQRAIAYVQLFRWLLITGWRAFPFSIIASAATSASSIALQGLALGIVVGAVSQFQNQGQLSTFPGLDRAGITVNDPHAATVIIAFVLLFIIASGLAYVGRSTAIRLESRMYRFFYDEVLGYVDRQQVETSELFRQTPRQTESGANAKILRVLLVDARFGGVILRLLLFNIIHFGNLLVGLLIITLFAPALLPLIGIFAIIAGLFMYPLNLRAARTTRMLEEHGPKRSAMIKKRVGSTAANEPSDDAVVSDEDDALGTASIGAPSSEVSGADEDEVIDRHLVLVENRLRILELSRSVMSILVACGIGALVWLLLARPGPAVVNYSSLLVLFFGLRFVMNGMEGVLVTVTSINRFLPNLLRLRELLLQLQAEHSVAEKIGALSQESEWHDFDDMTELEPSDVVWELRSPHLEPMRGRFRRGESYGLIGIELPRETAVAQLHALGRTARPPFNAELAEFEQARTERACTCDKADIDWILAVCAAGNIPLSAETAEHALNEQTVVAEGPIGHLVRFLRDCRSLAKRNMLIVVLDGNELFKMDQPGVAKVCSLFPDSILFFFCSGVYRALNNSPAKLLFLSDGKEIACAVSIAERDRSMDRFVDKVCRGKLPQVAKATNRSRFSVALAANRDQW